MGSQYNVRIRAKPTGLVYSGHWSDWSDVLHDHTPTDRGKLTLTKLRATCLLVNLGWFEYKSQPNSCKVASNAMKWFSFDITIVVVHEMHFCALIH